MNSAAPIPEPDTENSLSGYSFTGPNVINVAVLSLLAAALHGGVTGAHFTEWIGYGIFFLFSTMMQAFYGFIMLMRYWEAREDSQNPDPRMTRKVPWERGYYQAGIWGNLAVIALYVASRTSGVPFFGPEAGQVEAWDFYGVVTTLLEVAMVFLLIGILKDLRSEQEA